MVVQTQICVVIEQLDEFQLTVTFVMIATFDFRLGNIDNLL
jgi:hypothetical protein